VLKREIKAKKYHEDLNKRVHEPYYNQHMREAHMHKPHFQNNATMTSVPNFNTSMLNKNNTQSELKSIEGVNNSHRSKSIVTE
jgi:hypothetical protein